jgi:hypothetical protein
MVYDSNYDGMFSDILPEIVTPTITPKKTKVIHSQPLQQIQSLPTTTSSTSLWES